ncbi:hypothetical protein ACQ4PT_019499 [Festuca glaucescens]
MEWIGSLTHSSPNRGLTEELAPKRAAPSKKRRKLRDIQGCYSNAQDLPEISVEVTLLRQGRKGKLQHHGGLSELAQSSSAALPEAIFSLPHRLRRHSQHLRFSFNDAVAVATLVTLKQGSGNPGEALSVLLEDRCSGQEGHHKAACSIPKTCFICGSLEHEVDDCPVKKQPHQLAKFVGSAASRLGFYHIELPFQVNPPSSAPKNIGLVYIDKGEITKEELYHGLAKIYRTNWPWHIRQLDEWNFLVKFPPHLKVEEIAGYPSFGLPKEGVFVKVHVWSGILDYYANLQEVWLQIRGLNQDWCKRPTPMQFVTAFGIMLDVDWYGMFRTFYEIVRVKIKCRDHSRIPAARIFEIDGFLFQIKFAVEGPSSVTQLEEGVDYIHPPHPGDNDDHNEDSLHGDDDGNMDTDNSKQVPNQEDSANKGTYGNKTISGK